MTLTLTLKYTARGHSMVAGGPEGPEHSFPAQMRPLITNPEYWIINEGHGNNTPVESASIGTGLPRGDPTVGLFNVFRGSWPGEAVAIQDEHMAWVVRWADYWKGATDIALGNNPFATNIGVTTVTVTHSSHGMETGDSVSFTGVTDFAGYVADATINLNASANINNYFEITKVNANSYTVEMAAAGSTTNGGGAAVLVRRYILDPAYLTAGAGTSPAFPAALDVDDVRASMHGNSESGQIQRNGTTADIGVGGTVDSVLDSMDALATANTAGSFLAVGDNNSSVEGIGSAGWAQVGCANRELQVTYRGNYMDLHYCWDLGCLGTPQDLEDIRNDIPPESCRAPGDSLHPSIFGNGVTANCTIVWVGSQNGRIWVDNKAEYHLTGSDATTAQTLHGHVFDIPYEDRTGGGALSFSLISGDTVNFEIASASSPAVRRKTATVLDDGPIEVGYRAQKIISGNVYHADGVAFLYIGAPSQEAVSVSLNGLQGSMMADSMGVFDLEGNCTLDYSGKQFTFVACVEFGEGFDNQLMYLLGNDGQLGCRVRREVNNTLRIQANDAANLVVFDGTSFPSGAGFVTGDKGFLAIMISGDTTSGSESLQMTVNGVDVLAPGSTITTDGVIQLRRRAVPWGASQAHGNPFIGNRKFLWFGNSRMDVTDPAVIAQFFDVDWNPVAAPAGWVVTT